MQRFLVGCFLAALLLCRALPGSAQPVTDGEGDVGIGTLRPHPSALLDLASASRGVLLPRMTRAQRDAIARPAPGLLLYNNTDSLIQINCGSEAEPIWCTLVRERPEGGLTARLSPGALWFGGADSSVIELPPGPDGAVLRIDDGEPVWDMGSLLPPGTGANTTLRWNGSDWVENPNLRSDSAGNTTVEGNVTVNGSTVTMPNLPVTGAGTTVVVTDGAGNLQRIDVNDLLGNSTLNENALWVGDAANNPAEMPSTNVPGSVLQQDGTGAPVWDDDLNVNSVSVDSLTVNAYANITSNVFTTDSTVFNTNVVFNDTAQFNNYTNINGVEITVDSSVSFYGGAVTINADSTVVNNVFVTNDSAYFNGPTIFGDTVIFNTLPSLPLSENAMYLGNGDNVAAELATTNVPGSVLQQDGTGAPVWDDDLNVNSVSVDSLTVNAYANITNNVFTTDSTVFNTNVVFNDTAQFNNYTNINGLEITIDSTANFWNAVTINADSTVVNNVFVSNDSAYFNGPTIFGDTVIFNTLPSLPLSENAMYLGNGDNVAAELAPGNDGDVLTINGTMPTWTANPGGLLPEGTANNTTLVWDNVAGEWVENTEVTLDPTNGNTAINGNLNVDGTTVSVPNIPNVVTGTDVVITDGAGNLQTIDINDLVGNATLTQNNIWVGDASNNPAELAPGADGDVLTINGTTPTWTSNPGGLLPEGTANNTTLVWDNVAGEWIENTEVTLDPTNGNTDINGDLNIDGTTVSVPNIPNVVAGTDVVITDGAGNLQTIDINDLVDNATLTQDNIWVGDASNNPAELAPGADGDVLTINGTTPTWTSNPGGLLPEGTANNTTLVWDNVAGEWIENTEVTLDPTNGNTAINGDLNVDGDATLNGTTVSVPNIPNVVAGTDVVITDGAGNLQTIDINDLVDNATLTQNNIWVGDVSNNPAELAPGTTDQVLQIDGSGSPTWQTLNLLPTGTATNTTLVWDNVAGEWVENTEVTLDPTNGNTDINGDLNIDGTTVSVPNIPNVVTGTDVVITDGAGNLQTIDINDLVGNATLTQDNIWVGDVSNNPAELAPGTTDQVLQIDGSGSPSWQTLNLLPTGTAANTTLVWDNVAGEWIENTEVTLDPTNGNTAINGDLNVDGDATLNGTTVSVPNIPNVVTGTDVVITDGAGNLQTIDINDLVDNATLTQNNIWVGDASNNPAELAPGNDGDVLTINGTTPTWTANPGGLLPGGTTLNSTLRWDGAEWVENTNLRSDASGNTVNEGTLTSNGAVTAAAAGNTVGDNTASRQLTVEGVADAVVGNTLAGNPAVWDQVVEGDLVATGIVKVGGSMWLDGTSAGNHRLASNDDLNIGTTTADNLSLSTDGTAALVVNGATQQVNVQSALNLDGTNVPLLADGTVGAAGQALVSGGTGATPSWTTLGAANLALSQNAMLVGNASNMAAELPATANRILATNGAGVPSWSSSLPAGVTVGFDQITSGTNTAAVMNVGTGASLQPTGSGTVTANRIVGTGSTTNAVDLATAEVSGTLPINRGGTNGTATPTAGAVAYGTGSAYAFSAAGTSGYLLRSGGAGAPTWGNPNDLFWQLTGNSSTSAAMHFLGTTDALPLNFRTNNVERLRITSAGLMGTNTASTAPRAFLHIGFIANQDVPGLLVGNDYTVNGVAGARSIFPSESWFAYPGIVGIGDRGSTNDIPSIAPYGTVGVVGASGGGTGGRTEVGVYGHGYLNNLFNGNQNHGWGGLFRARITSAVPDFNGTLVGVRAEAYSNEGLSSTGGPSPNPDGGEVYGIYSTAVGNATDTTFGGYFSATGAATNYGVYSNAGTNYFASNVGIGLTEPTNRLHVSAASDPLRLEGLVDDPTLTNVLVADATGVVHRRTVTSLGGSFWGLTGNSGTNASTNFLGTTDAQSLVFRTNNTERARFDETNGGHFVPGADDTYDLGSALLRWRDLYLGPTSLHVVSTAAETTTPRDWSLGIQESAGASEGNLRITEGGNDLVNITPAGRVGIGEADPDAMLHIAGAGNTAATTSLQVINTDGDNVLSVQDNMVMRVGDPTSALDSRIELAKDNGGSFVIRRTSDNVNFEGTVSRIDVTVPSMYFLAGSSPQLSPSSPIRSANGLEGIYVSEGQTPTPATQVRISLGAPISTRDGVYVGMPVSPQNPISRATGTRLVQTFSASANNQEFAALSIEPTFNNGAFTGVRNYVMDIRRSNGNSLLAAQDNGNVGIGVSAPTTSLHVSAASDPLRLEGLVDDPTLTNVLVADATGVVHRRTVSSLIGDMPLTQDNIWVGDASNNPAELAPGADGDVLTISGTTPTWTSNPGGLLPGGTTLNSTLRWDGAEWVENTNLRSDASGNTVNEGTLTSNGAVTAAAAGNTVGDNTASRQLTVEGVADAVVGNTLAGNPAVWDQVVEGDLVATGIVKVGGSVWIDGQTADYHRIASDDDLDVGTTSDQDLTLSANGAVGLRVVGSNQRINIESELNLRGGATPLLAGGSAGTAGQALVSGGTGVTPSWTTLGAANLALSQNAMLVGNASNIAAELPATANRILATSGAGVPSWSSSLPAGVTVGFDQITGGTNTAAVMNVGTGASLQPTGSGTVTANRIVGTGSTTNAVDLATAEVSGTLPINRGGTNGTATPTAGAVAYGTGSAYAFTAAGTSGNVLVSAGAGAPTWGNPNGLFWGLTGNSGTNASTNFLGTTDATRLAFRTNNTERMTLSTAGHLGLGTTNPGGIITIINDDVSDVTDDLIMATYSATYTPLLRMARARGTVAAPAQLLQNDVIGLMSFSGNSATLIGAEIVAVADANHSVTDQSTRLEFVTNDGTTTATRMTIDDDGRVGIGTNAPNAAVFLHVVGDAGKTAGGTTWVNLSDGRMKDVQGDYTKGLAEIIGLKPVVYRYKPENTWGAPSDVDQYGFIAQEVETVFPEAVSTGEDGYLVFNMHPILVAYANAVKELNEKVETLEEEKAEMMDLLEELRSRVEALEGN